MKWPRQYRSVAHFRIVGRISFFMAAASIFTQSAHRLHTRAVKKISRSTPRSFLSRSGMVFGAATRALTPGQLLRRSASRTLSCELAPANKKQ